MKAVSFDRKKANNLFLSMTLHSKREWVRSNVKLSFVSFPSNDTFNHFAYFAYFMLHKKKTKLKYLRSLVSLLLLKRFEDTKIVWNKILKIYIQIL